MQPHGSPVPIQRGQDQENAVLKAILLVFHVFGKESGFGMLQGFGPLSTTLVPGCSWLLLAAPGSSWLLLVPHGCSWFLMAASGCFWLLMAAHFML